MERNPPPKPKTYSDVMNEWTAQKDFIGQSRSRVFHPPYDAPLPVKIFGYLWRVALLICVPATVFILLVRSYGKSPQFNKDIEPVVLRHLGAATGETTGINWQPDGRLNARMVEANGGPHSFFHELKALTIISSLPVSGIFKKAWVIPFVNVNDLSIVLRTGATGDIPVYETDEEHETLEMNPFRSDPATPPLRPPPVRKAPGKETPTPDKPSIRGPLAPDEPLNAPSLLDDPPPKDDGGASAPASGDAPLLMRAGYGINPDPAAIRVLHYRGAQVDLKWGGAPVTAGALLNTVAELDRTAAGWSLTAAGGDFRQGWMRGLQMKTFKADITETQLEVRESRFTHPGNTGETKITGTVTFGDLPLVKGVAHLQRVPLHPFVADALGAFFQAQVTGDLELSGSLNRSTGVETSGVLTLDGGRISGLPLQRVLQTLTGEDQLLQLPVKSGAITLKTHGSDVNGALVVEIPSLEVDCGALARVRATARYEQARSAPPPQNPQQTAVRGKKAAPAAVPPPSPQPAKFTLTGELRIGLASFAVKKISPAILKKFFTMDDSGEDWYWITMPLTEEPRNLSADLAEQLSRLHNEGRKAE